VATVLEKTKSIYDNLVAAMGQTARLWFFNHILVSLLYLVGLTTSCCIDMQYTSEIYFQIVSPYDYFRYIDFITHLDTRYV